MKQSIEQVAGFYHARFWHTCQKFVAYSQRTEKIVWVLKVCSGQNILYVTRRLSAELLGGPYHTNANISASAQQQVCFKFLTNHTFAARHCMKKKFCQYDVSRKSCKTSLAGALREKNDVFLIF